MAEVLPMSEAAEIIERLLQKSPFLLLYLKLTRVYDYV
jgi:hypothetical protein